MIFFYFHKDHNHLSITITFPMNEIKKTIANIKLYTNIIFYFLKEGSPTPVASKPPSTDKI